MGDVVLAASPSDPSLGLVLVIVGVMGAVPLLILATAASLRWIRMLPARRVCPGCAAQAGQLTRAERRAWRRLEAELTRSSWTDQLLDIDAEDM